MKLQDDRTQEEKQTHVCLIGGTDIFLSGWGLAAGGASYAFWACEPKHAHQVMQWVQNRHDIMRIRQVSRDYRPSGRGHCHIYTVNEGHNALK